MLWYVLVALTGYLALDEANILLDAVSVEHGLLGRAAHLIVDFGAGIVCTAAALRHRGGERAGWLLIAIGIVAWTSGDTYWTTALLDQESIPVPSPADIGYLTFAVLAFPGLLLVLHARVRSAPRTLWVDGVIAALATSALAAAIVVPAVVDFSGSDLKSVATNAAYPLSDLILLGLVVGAVAVRGWRIDRVWALAGLGIAAFWVTDSHYLFAVADNTYTFPDLFDIGWSLAFLGLGGAALQPARAAAAVTVGRRVAVMPLVFSALALGVLVDAGLRGSSAVAVGLGAASIVAAGVRLWLTFRDNAAMLATTRREALTDALTGLGNRRALMQDLERRLVEASPGRPVVLALFDLDGFKHYNDCFGHPAGDDLLVRLGGAMAREVRGTGRAYRMGGDEFCALLRPGDGAPDAVAADAAAALSERGEGFHITASHGAVVLPRDTADPAEALRLADHRMYAQKHGARASAGSQSRDVLLRALSERKPGLGEHNSIVAELAVAVAQRMGLDTAAVEEVRQAADLHDVGKVAIPDAILDKPGPLDDDEWAFMRRHTVIGERIVAAAPALRRVAKLVRASHERHDGRGYPDGLTGQEIPLGARIVAVCDAFDAMVAERPYRPPRTAEEAIAELRACAGAQFDPEVVDAFATAFGERAAAPPLADAA